MGLIDNKDMLFHPISSALGLKNKIWLLYSASKIPKINYKNQRDLKNQTLQTRFKNKKLLEHNTSVVDQKSKTQEIWSTKIEHALIQSDMWLEISY